MLANTDYIQARNLLLEKTKQMGKESLPLYHCYGRVLAEDITAAFNVPAFDRSPYDGYALRSADTVSACEENPVTLRVAEEIPAGSVPTKKTESGTAARIMTGAPIPEGADAVIKFENTKFDDESVTIFSPLKSGENVVHVGEDVKEGTVLIKAGSRIDPGMMGTIAGQGISFPKVRIKPQIGIISTGSELTEPGDALTEGHIYNTNRYTLTGALESLGCDVLFFGIAGDNADDIAEAIGSALSCCDAVVTTGGVSVGDYDLTPEAMEKAGAEILVRGVNMKPGMACCFGVKTGKLILGLSGNPSSSLVSFYACCVPAIRRLCGEENVLPEMFTVKKPEKNYKERPVPSFLKGRVNPRETELAVITAPRQGNAVISSSMGSNVLVIAPAADDENKELKGFLI